MSSNEPTAQVIVGLYGGSHPIPDALAPELHARLSECRIHRETLLVELAKVDAEVKGLEAVFAPIRTIPNEILLSIFKSVDDGTTTAKSARVVLTQVCKRWRRLLRSSPSFWTTFTVDWRQVNEDDPGPDILNEYHYDARALELHRARSDAHVVEQCLYLSHNRPLDLTIQAATFAIDMRWNALQGLLITHCRRWRNLTIVAPTEDIRHFMASMRGVQLPLIQSLVLHSRTPDQSIIYDLGNPLFPQTVSHLDINVSLPPTIVANKLISFVGSFISPNVQWRPKLSASRAPSIPIGARLPIFSYVI